MSRLHLSVFTAKGKLMSLQEQVNRAKRTVNTDTLSFSINEFIGMYEEGEININPAFQRTSAGDPSNSPTSLNLY